MPGITIPHKGIIGDKKVLTTRDYPRTKEAQRARRQLFAAAFLGNGGNACAAARTACGCSAMSARTLGKRLLGHPDVIAILDRAVQAKVKASGMTLERKREILAEIAEDIRNPPNARIGAISLDSDIQGDKAPSRSMSASISATVGPDGQITADPLAALAPRLDAWRRILQLRKPTPSEVTGQDKPDTAKVDSGITQMDNSGQTPTAEHADTDKV
jgi:signal transduction histidine kinase